MPKENVALSAFNRGKISRLGLARTDIKRTALSAEVMINWMPRVLGAMSLRPGLGYIGATRNNAEALHLPFIYATDDTAILELTDSHMRVRVNESIVTTASTTITLGNGDFTGSEPTLTAKLTDPTIGAISPTGLCFSPDGSVCIQIGTASPYVNAFALSGSTVVAITAPSGLSAAVNGCVFSPDGTRLYLSSGANVLIYTVTGTGASAAFVFLANLSPATASDPLDLAFSDDGAMLVAGLTNSTTAAVYYKTGDTYASVTGPTLTWAAANATGVSVSLDGTYLAVCSGTTPYINVFVRSGSAGAWTFTKLTNPATLPTGAATDVSISPDNTAVAVSHTTSPYVTIYTLSGSATPVKITNPGTLPTGNGTSVHYGLNNDYLAVSHTTTPFVTIYSRASTTYTKITNPGTLPSANALGVRFGGTQRHLAVINGSAPLIAFYDWGIWQDGDQSGATSSYASGVLSLTGTVFNSAIRRQWVSVPPSLVGTTFQIRFTVTRGYVACRIGSWYGKDDVFSSATLKAGTHSFTITPTAGHFVVELGASTQYASLMTGAQIEATGDLDLPTIWAADDLENIRFGQSGDIVFVACLGKRQQQIERRSTTSWSVVDYNADDGPFRTENTTGISMTPSALTGDVTITASQNFFKSTNVGGLLRITSIGQTVTSNLNGADQFTNYIKVTGTSTARNFTIVRAGTWSGTLTVQRSISEPGAWVDTATTYTTNGTATYNDSLDNEIVYYRVGFKTGEYTSGTATVTLTYENGGLTGIARITSFASEVSVGATVLVPFGSTSGSTTWAEGNWSPRRGYPSSIAFYEGRQWWSGKDKILGSISDAFSSFDDTEEGDSAPISRSIGEGPVDTINWLLPLKKLIIGGQAAERSARSSSFDELLTATNFNIKDCSTYGSAGVAAVKLDTDGFFVQQGRTRVIKLTYDTAAYDYGADDMTTLVPEQCSAGVVSMAVQRKPDARLHCVLSDGTAAVMVYDKVEDVICWLDIETDGLIEGVLVLPSDTETGAPEDRVYYLVNRTIGGVTKRYLERWAEESDCVGEDINKQADSYIVYDSTSTTTIPGLSHLEGETVVVWADGLDVGTKVVASGQITLDTAAEKVVAGLYYRSRFKSAKLAYGAGGGTALTRKKKLTQFGLILDRTHAQGVKVGRDFDHLSSLPLVIDEKTYAGTEILDQKELDLMEFDGDWDTDSRLCLQAAAPRPATILCAVIGVETNG